jgi:hypothetical protein
MDVGRTAEEMKFVSDNNLLVMIVTLDGEGTVNIFQIGIKYYKVLKTKKEIKRRIGKINIRAYLKIQTKI